MATCIVYKLGMVEYGEAYRIQRRLRSRKINGQLADVLLILEHPPTFTVGKSGKLENILVSNDQLRRNRISLFCTGRGGDVTYHGPGQMIAYPIVSLKRMGKDLHYYVHALEEVVIRTLKDFRLCAHRDESHAGVWVGKEELAAIGISIRKWITMHGIALNVNPNLEHFSYINPCGFSDRQATSLSKLLGYHVSMERVINRFISHFSDVFETSIVFSLLPEQRK